jgi:pectate lyase
MAFRISPPRAALLPVIAVLSLAACGDDSGSRRDLPSSDGNQDTTHDRATELDGGDTAALDSGTTVAHPGAGTSSTKLDGALPPTTTPDAGHSSGSAPDAGKTSQTPDDRDDAGPSDTSPPEPVGDGSCPSTLAGWASVSGDGVTTTTGGGSAKAVRPKSAAELQKYATDSAPQVIELTTNFAVPELKIGSNKTLVGIGDNITISGGIAIKGDKNAAVSNVILRNIHVNGGTASSDDAVTLQYAHHVWIDHCDIYDGPDGSLDMTHAINWVTVSWTKVRYTDKYHNAAGEEVAEHRFASLIGHSDNNASEDTNRIKVTFHHDWWAEGVLERMPRVRFGQVHVYNNYFGSAGNHYCVRAGAHAAVLLESNYFDGVASPHQFNSADDQKTANITARDNVYNKTSGDQAMGGGGPAFTKAPYSPEIQSAASVPEQVKRCAGPH